MKMEVLMISFLMIYIIFSEIRNYLERKTLLDRIMSKDYAEYATNEIGKRNFSQKVERPIDDRPSYAL
tara:strand:- start:137 stop:340 length:204 start_codon:yes stop_codon:yes gene_type:complete